MNGLLQDLRYALRQLRKSPGFVAVAVLTLALGLAANTVIFSVINATLFKPLSFPDSDRLALVWATYGGPQNINIISAPNYWDFKSQNHVFEDIAILDSSGRGYNLSASGAGQDPEQVSGVRVSANFFNVLGVKPFLGRTFLPEEEIRGQDHEVVLSYGLWKRRYGADSTLVGRTIKVDGENFVVIGVMPSDFSWQLWSAGPRQLWVPVGYTDNDRDRSGNSFLSFARLKSGVTLAQAQAEMANIGSRLSQQYPKELAGMSATAMSMSEYGTQGVKTTMTALFAAVGFVLLIACVNIANLLLARGAGRKKELALRRTLGAGGFRIARQLMTESVLLALLGGGVGLVLAAWSASVLITLIPDQLQLPPRPFDSIPIDSHVLGFTLLITCMTGILFGLVPAIGALRGDMNQPLKDGGRGASNRSGRLRHVLVASEVALALVVLCGAGLMIESMSRLLAVQPGFNPKNVLTMQLSLPQENLYVGPPGHTNFCRDMDEQVSAIPGVISVGAAGHLPLVGSATRGFTVEGRPTPAPENTPNANYSVTCPNYFKTMGIPILEGREFNQLDTLNSTSVIVVNRAMAAQIWPNESAIGKRINQAGKWHTIVGVVADFHHWGLAVQTFPQFFCPYTQAGWPLMNVVVRTSAAPMSFSQVVKKAMLTVEPDRPVSDIAPMDDVVAGSVQDRRFPMLLLSGFAALALVLAAVGIIGVVSYSVAQRTHEIGIRMALGARPGDVLRLVVSGSMNWVLAGIGVGILGALALTQVLERMLFEVKPTNPGVLGIVSLLLASVALLASYVPARRAAKVDPMVALRYE
jgi:predicted permease